MKIGILTFHSAINYGAVFQAYGLQSFLQDLGHEVYIIDYRPEYLTKPTQVWRFNAISYENPIQFVKDLVRECLVIPIRVKRNRIFGRFNSKYLRLKKIDFTSSECDIDVFFFGSDQIWNPSITCGYDDIYFGKFKATKGKKIISYAASCGAVDNLNDKTSLFNYLLNFNSISVRERSLKSYLDKIVDNKSVHVCVDPVLLAGRKAYERIINDFTPKKEYILLFQLFHDKAVFRDALKLANDYALDLIEISPYTDSLTNKYIINGASPCKLLAYIKNASYILTSSYHGTILSILFRKNFNAIFTDRTRAERTIDLLTSINLSDRITNQVDKLSPIEYSVIEDNYSKLLQSSRQYIIEVLGGNE